MAIDKTRWLRLSPLLDELLDLQPGPRLARLAALRAQDPTLAGELEALLQEQDALQELPFLNEPVLPRELATAGQQVGAYTLEHELGRGGMGSVWLARRTDGRFDGQVAIKFLASGLFGRGDAGRFAREGQILARLAHPHIARLLDAGVIDGHSAGQQPYLVLEYVQGEPIDRYCQQQALDLRQRVQLFLDVLAAVAHAHNRLILHRDLKPSNILVSQSGEVKLLDFGIAKLLHEDGEDGGGSRGAATELTRQAGRAFTPQYAAPEQVQGGDVTTATDVYALGVLLYLLLAGSHPTLGLQGDPKTAGSALEQLRTVVEVEPRRLSDAARARLGRKAALLLRGDLDTIVAKALKKAPTERYENAAALADELRRWLADEPIAARPDSRRYVFAKFLRRHRLGVAAGSAVTLALAGGLGLALLKEREAQAQREQAEGLIEFMLGDLRKKLEPVGRLDVLDAVGSQALRYYGAQAPDRLDADSLGRRARALHLMGEMAELRGRLDEAQLLFRQAAESTAELMARDPGNSQRIFDHSQSAFWVGYIALARSHLPEARQMFETYLRLAQQLTRSAPDNQSWRGEEASAHLNLGVLLIKTGESDAALQSLQRARQLWEPMLASDASVLPALATALGWSAKVHQSVGDYAAALEVQFAKMKLAKSASDFDSNAALRDLFANAHDEAAQLQLALDRREAAAAHGVTAAEVYAALHQSETDNLDWLSKWCFAQLHLAEARFYEGRHNEALTLLQAVAPQLERLLAKDSGKSLWQVHLRGQFLALQARLGPAPGQPPIAGMEAFVADLAGLAAAGQMPAAESLRVIADVRLLLGDALAAAGRPDRAQTQWQQALDLLAQETVQDPQRLALQALLHQRLGQQRERRLLIETLRGSALRHPRYAEALNG